MEREENIKIISERLRIARERKGLSKKELAQKIGVAPSSITRYENEGRIPKASILLKISEVLGVSVDYLLGKEESEEIKIALHTEIGDISDLPEEAIKSIQDFIEYVRNKYGKKKKQEG
ncbi:MAG: XRE family transcriptional regulator [Dictyoglomus thermophilum]